MASQFTIDPIDETRIFLGTKTYYNIHRQQDCLGRACIIHNPSKHHMRDWDIVVRSGGRFTERRCRHDVGHPDPDALAYAKVYLVGMVRDTHSCDGCCAPPTAYRYLRHLNTQMPDSLDHED